MFKVNKNAVMRYAVPFYFEGEGDSYKLIYDKLNADKENWELAAKSGAERDTFDYLYEAVGCSCEDNKIGSEWKFNLSDNPVSFLYYPDAKDPQLRYNVKFREMGMFLFRTNIGILWYEITPPFREEDNNRLHNDSFLLLFQNRFKELNYRSKKHFKVVSQTGEEKSFILGDVICNILNNVNESIHFISGQRNAGQQKRPDKALIFNYILLEGNDFDEKSLRTRAFSFANGYNENYKMIENATEDFSAAFDKTCWYASKSGCGYFAYKNLQEKNEFFENGIISRICNDYFFMYILALYQSYSLLNYLREIMQKFPANAENYFEEKPSEKLEGLTARINTFLLKGIYSSVSNVHHHNKFFMYLQKQLNIREDIESITMGINAMVKMQSIYKDRQDTKAKEEEEKRERKHNNQVNMILTIISTLSVFSALLDMHELLSQIKAACGTDGYLKGIWALLCSGDIVFYFQIVFGLVLVGLSLACIFIMIKNVIENKKKDDL